MRVAQTRRCCEDQGMQKVRALGGNSPGCLQETLSGSSSICRSVDLGHSQSASSISPSNHLHCLLSSFIVPLNHGILPNIYSPLMSKPSLSPSLSPKTSLSPNLLTCYVPLMDSVLIITHSLTHHLTLAKRSSTCPCSNTSFFTSSPHSLLHWTVDPKRLDPLDLCSLRPHSTTRVPLGVGSFIWLTSITQTPVPLWCFLPAVVADHSVICRHHSPQRSQRTCTFSSSVSSLTRLLLLLLQTSR